MIRNRSIASLLAAISIYRGIAQSGSASALGAEGRGFKSLCPDQIMRLVTNHKYRMAKPFLKSASMQYISGFFVLLK